MSLSSDYDCSQAPYVAFRKALSRRRFLTGTGVLLALPLLECMTPAFAAPGVTSDKKPRRMIGICNNLGLLPQNFFPKGQGSNYELSPYLKLLEAHRKDFTVFSGISHPDVDGGHPADNCFLTAAPHPGNGGFRNTISLDQYIAERIGFQTRYRSMTLGVNVARGVRSLSWTGGGIMIPCEEKPSEVFRKIFLGGKPEEIAEQERRLVLGRSILDAVGAQASEMRRSVGAQDRDRLDQYFQSVRELEQQLKVAKEWERRPRPIPKIAAPEDPETPKQYMEKVKLMYDMARVAVETDSTRAITIMLDSVNSPAIELDHDTTAADGYHNLSHHGRSAAKLAQLRAIDELHIKNLGALLNGLKATKENGESLLDRTMVLYGSNLGNANTHENTNLPTLFAGGGFRHGQHLVFDAQKNYPMPNLFVSMLQRMGIETDSFASSTGTFRGLEMQG